MVDFLLCRPNPSFSIPTQWIPPDFRLLPGHPLHNSSAGSSVDTGSRLLEGRDDERGLRRVSMSATGDIRLRSMQLTLWRWFHCSVGFGCGLSHGVTAAKNGKFANIRERCPEKEH